MSRASILAGKAVIVVSVEDQISKGLAQVQNKIAKMTYSLRSMGDQAGRGGFLGGLVSAGMLRSFVRYEDQLLSMAAKLGIVGVKTKEQIAVMDSLERKISQVAATSNRSREDVAAAGTELAAAGFDASSIEAMLQGVLDTARGTGYAVDETSKFLGNLVKNFKLFDGLDTVEQRVAAFSKLTSQMVLATNMGTIEMEDLGESFKYAGGTAKTLGETIPRVLAMFVEMSESGLKASLAGTSMNVAMLNMIKNSAKLKDIAPDFKISEDAQGNVMFIETLDDLFKISDKLSKQEQVSLFGDIFNIRGARMVTSAQDLDKIRENTVKIGKAMNEASMQAREMDSGVGGAFRRIASAIDKLNVDVISSFADQIIASLNVIGPLLNNLGKSIASSPLTTGLIVFSPVILGAAAIGLYAIAAALTKVAQAATLTRYALSKVAALANLSLTTAIRGTSAAFSPGKAELQRRKDLMKQQKAVTRLTAKMASMQANAAAKGTAAAQAKAAAKIANSKTAKQLAAAQAGVASLSKPTLFQKVAGAAKKVGAALSGGMAKARSGIQGIANYRAEQAFYKSRIGLTKAYQKIDDKRIKRELADVQGKKTIAKLNAVELKTKKSISAIQLGVTSREKEAVAKLAQQTKFGMVQERTYDRLYKVRKSIQTLESQAGNFTGPTNAAQGKRTPAHQANMKRLETNRVAQLDKLRSREARMVKIVNTRNNADVAQRVLARTRLASDSKQAILSQRLRSIEVRKIKTIVNAEKSAAALRGAGSLRYADRAAKIREMQSLKSASKMGALKNIGGGVMKGIGVLLKGGAMGAVKTLFMLGRGLTFVGTSLFKIALGTNPLGILLNVLLLFGDRIPFVVNTFKALGQGFSDAFAEIFKIGNAIGPVMALIQTAFSAFREGNTDIGFKALYAAFSGLAGVISGQLTAAWNAFMARVAYIQVFFQQIFTSISTIFSSLISSISTILGGLAGPNSPLGMMFSGMSGMMGGGSFNFSDIAKYLVIGADYLITGLSTLFLQFQNSMYDLFHTALTPLLKSSMFTRGVSEQFSIAMATAQNKNKVKIGDAEKERAARSKAMEEVFAKTGTEESGKYQQKVLEAQNESYKSHLAMVKANEDLQAELAKFRMKVEQTDQQMKLPGTPDPDRPTKTPPPAMKAMLIAAASVVGSLSQTRGNLYDVSRKTEQDLLAEIAKNTKDTKDELALGGSF